MEKLGDKIRVISPSQWQHSSNIRASTRSPKWGAIVLALNVGPLLRIWGLLTGSSSLAPSSQSLDQALVGGLVGPVEASTRPNVRTTGSTYVPGSLLLFNTGRNYPPQLMITIALYVCIDKLSAKSSGPCAREGT